ncbi:MAG: LytR/AlgR family response regulator transcription factor [Bacteroidales bacterium]
MKYDCIIIEDNPPAQRILKAYISDIGTLELKQSFNDGLSAIEYLQNHSVDIIFLDIQLPKISGIDLLKIIDNKSCVILTTAYQDYALQSYEYEVVDYLLKPFSFQRFVKSIFKCEKKLNNIKSEIKKTDSETIKSSTNNQIFIKSGYEYIKVDINSIVYIKSDGDYTEIITEEKRILSSSSLKHWCENLNHNNFIQCHKSFLVNIKFITKLSGNQIITPMEQIPIGRSFKENIFNFLLE